MAPGPGSRNKPFHFQMAQTLGKRKRAAGGTRPRKLRKTQKAAMRRNIRYGGFSGLERKFLDCAWNGVALATGGSDASGGELQPSTGCTNAISVPAQGDGESNRDGRRYNIKSCFFSGVIDHAPRADQPDADDVGGYFFALVLDLQANGSTIASEDVYVNPGTSAACILPTPLRNLENSQRFRILDSKYISPRGSYGVTDGASTASLNHQQKIPVSLSWSGDIGVTCTGTTADVASVSDHALHIIAYAESTAYTPTFFGKSRLRFTG